MASRKKPKDDDLPTIARWILPIEQPERITQLIVVLAVLCIMLFIGDLAIHRHSYFQTEGLIGFYSLFGFAAFTFIVLATKGLKVLIGRSEDYYAPNAVDGEDYPEEELERKEHGDA